MLGRPTVMTGRNAAVNNSASTGLVGSSLAGLQPRPQNLRVKVKPNSETSISQIISAT